MASEVHTEFDVVAFLMAFEAGDLNQEESIEGFQNLIDTGLVWQLQGYYGRMAKRLIDEGCCVDTHGVFSKGGR